jgi:hypothetical protein
MENIIAFRAARDIDSLHDNLKESFEAIKVTIRRSTGRCHIHMSCGKQPERCFSKYPLADIRPRNKDAIVGHPIGQEGLLSELLDGMIAYTPEELISIGEKEFKWCVGELKKALDEFKNDFVEPGK